MLFCGGSQVDVDESNQTIETVNASELISTHRGPITLDDREGVFAQSFKCKACELKFVLLSWVHDRHDARNTYCPECGKITPKIHWRATLSQSRDFVDDDSSIEIYHMVPAGKNARMVSFPDPEALADQDGVKSQ